jgi:NAD(P)H-binding
MNQYLLQFVVLCFLIAKSLCFSTMMTTTMVRPPPPPIITKDVLDTKAFVETSTSTIKVFTKDVVQNVVVTGATGRTGRYVIDELLNRNVSNVIALVRNITKANDVFPNPPSNLHIIQCQLNNETQIKQYIQEYNIDAAIWCATGFSDAAVIPSTETITLSSFWDHLKHMLFGTSKKTSPIIASSLDTKQSIDLIGLPAIAKSLVETKVSLSPTDDIHHHQYDRMELPKIVMCSSAGVTRTIWDETKKIKYIGAADIPIVRLNPFNILDRKRESEELLRNNNNHQFKYCIVRPCGLNDMWPSNSRPLFTQGDVAVGRLHRCDLAKILVDVLSTPEATYKTFEVVGIANYPPSSIGIGPALQRLYKDSDLIQLSDDVLYATYTTMQQLLPGETQDAAALAMGQTYEQLDAGVVGRLGVRGQENIINAIPKPSSIEK